MVMLSSWSVSYTHLMRMADQRHIADEVRKQLVDNHAVGEALGQYLSLIHILY